MRTRRKRYFIGMYLLAVVAGNLRVITAAVDKLATAGAIRKHIARCLAKLGILEKKIYKLMTDYGSNVLKVGDIMRSGFVLPQNFADQNHEDECDVNEASDSELCEDVITAEDEVITVKCAIHTLQLRVHDFSKANSSAKEVVSKVKNVAKKTNKENIKELFKHNNNKPLPRLNCENRSGSTISMHESVACQGFTGPNRLGK